MFTIEDHTHMSRALKLAELGKYTTAPNPRVGCVIVKDGLVVGEGFHYRAGEPHAEVHALQAAKERAIGATVYVTLEPCSHYGRTPPCAEALITAKVGRVVCAMQDPNTLVSGRGIQMLRSAGIEVDVGLLEQDALDLNRAFIKTMRSGLPFVQLKLAGSLDGQTALKNGQSQWITSSQARQDVQAFRAQSGAILSTSKTVIEDNASLTVRWSELPASIQAIYPEKALRQPPRVILDRKQTLTPDLRFFQSQSESIIIAPSNEHFDELDWSKQLELLPTFRTLAKTYSINHLWVEAGATLSRSLIREGLVDELILYIAPKLMGNDGRGLLGDLGFTSLEQAIDLNIKEVRMVGKDLRIIANPISKE